MAIVKGNGYGGLGLLMVLALGMRGMGAVAPFDREAYWPLPNYKGSDDNSPERLVAAEAKRARKNAKRLMEVA